MGRRYFTVAEANALLPEMEEIFRRTDVLREEMAEGIDRLKILDALWGDRIEDPGIPDRGELLETRAHVRQVIARLERLVNERIVSEGVRFPQGGFEHGLLDFPTLFHGRTVFLCWHRGEEEIRAWHEVDAGYAGRRPLTPDQALRMGRG